MKSNAKRLMIAIHDMRGGGAERVVSILCNRFAQMGITVSLCYTGNNRSPCAYKLDKNVEIFYSKSRVMYCFNWMMGKIPIVAALDMAVSRWRFRMKAKHFRPSVILAVMEEPCRRALRAIRGLDIPVVLRACNSIEDQIAVHPGLRERYSGIFEELSGIVFQTPMQQKQYEDMFAFSAEVKKAVILNPIEPSPLWELERAPEKGQMVAVGNVRTQKGHPLMLRAFSKALKQFPDWELSIYGRMSRNSRFPALVAELGLEDKVHLHGFCPDVFERVRNASFYVMASKYEGLPNSLIEALCLGLPCITTDFGGGGARELIENGKSGLVVPVGDEDAMADAMCRLMGDPDFAESLGKEARRTRQRFDAESTALRWLDFLGLS